MTGIKFIIKITCLIMLFGVLSLVHADLYSAVATVQPLLETQSTLVENMEGYILKENTRLNVLEKYLKLLTKHEEVMITKNHICVKKFSLIKKLTIDLDFIEKTITEKIEYEKNTTMTYPTQEDVRGTARTLAHIQEIYNLNVTELANGLLNTSISTPMSSSDCYILGRALYEDKQYKQSLLWMMEVLSKSEEYDPDFYSEQDVVGYISYAYFALGDIRNTVDWTKYLMTFSHNDIYGEQNDRMLRDFEERLAEGALTMHQSEPAQTVLSTAGESYNESAERSIYEDLCRGQMSIPDEVSDRLRCRYLTDSHPFLTLARVKMEQLYLQPDVLLFHDVISDSEIEHFKNIAKTRLERSRYADNTSRGHSKSIIYKSTFLEDSESNVIARISRRVSHFTGLDASHAEPYQVANYGVGGHFTPHYDFSYVSNLTLGNIIATVLIYMSEVPQGGATIFPHLGLHVFPVKRAALFWMNLLSTGEGDIASRHAGCPVLRGNKWVLTKWITQYGQEFVKPCSLKNQDNRITHEKFPLWKVCPKKSLFLFVDKN